MGYPTKGYVLTKGKVHFVHPRAIVDLAITYCGLDLGDVNNQTTDVKEVTCQKCLMIYTKEWNPKSSGTKSTKESGGHRVKSPKSLKKTGGR